MSKLVSSPDEQAWQLENAALNLRAAIKNVTKFDRKLEVIDHVNAMLKDTGYKLVKETK